MIGGLSFNGLSNGIGTTKSHGVDFLGTPDRDRSDQSFRKERIMSHFTAERWTAIPHRNAMEDHFSRLGTIGVVAAGVMALLVFMF
jgi:hypothetical protein